MQFLARLSSMKLKSYPLPTHTLSALGLSWDRRGIVRMCDCGRRIVVQDYHLTFEDALELAASDGLTRMCTFLVELIEYRGDWEEEVSYLVLYLIALVFLYIVASA